MNELQNTTGTISTIELRDIVNEARKAMGEAQIRNDQFIARVENELDGEIEGAKFLHLAPRTKTPMAAYRLTRDQAMLVGMRESKAVRRKVLDKLKELESANLPAVPHDFATALRLAADLEEQKQLLQIENGQLAEQIGYLKNLFQEGMTVPQFCKQLNGVNVQQVNGFLQARSWLFHQAGQWRVAAYARDKYLTEHQSTITPHGKDPFIRHKPVLLKAGAARLHQIYLQGELPMKKSWDGQYTHDLEARS